MQTAKASANITTEKSSSGSKTVEAADLPIPVEPTDLPCAHVGYEEGFTRNLGNFESLRVTVHVTLPCAPTSIAIEAAYKQAQAFVQAHLGALHGHTQPNTKPKPNLNEAPF